MSASLVITHIKPLPQDPNLRRVYVNKKVVALLRATDVDHLQLREGMPWTARVESAVTTEHAALKARRTAMQMLGRRPLSRGELIDRLVLRKHPKPIAMRIADELAADDWINDTQYARELVQSLLRSRPASRKLLQSKLAARKIDRDLANEVLNAELGHNEDESAIALARQRLGTMKNLPTATAARRIAGVLARRGFDDQAVSMALEQIGLDVETPIDHES